MYIFTLHDAYFFHGDRQKLMNATSYDPYVSLWSYLQSISVCKPQLLDIGLQSPPPWTVIGDSNNHHTNQNTTSSSLCFPFYKLFLTIKMLS